MPQRAFTRYKKRSGIEFSLGNAVFQATLNDYSLNGFGFTMQGNSSLPPGSDISFTVKDLAIEGEGSLVWSCTRDSVTSGGIERNYLSGSLGYFPLADILIDLHTARKNGMLEVSETHIVKRIYFRNGNIVFAVSNSESDRLIKVLLHSGKITEGQYNEAIDIANKTSKSHGAVLVKRGFLKAEDLIWAAKRQVEEIIMSLFELEQGRLNFSEVHLLPEGSPVLRLSIHRLLYSGIKRITNLSYLLNLMPPLDTVLVFSPGIAESFRELDLDGNEKDILSFIDGKNTIRKILESSPMNHFQTLKMLYGLYGMRVLRDAGSGDCEDRNPVCEQPEEIDAEFLHKVEETHRIIGSTDYYRILRVERCATLSEIKKAYYEAAKEFHPDRHLNIAPGPVRNKLNTIFSALNSMYKILSDSEKRMAYDRELSGRQAKTFPDVRTGTDNSQLANIKFREGEDWLRKGRYTEAGDLFRQAAYLDGSVPDYSYYLGVALAKKKNFHEAGKVLNEAAKRNPKNPAYLAELGHVYVEMGFVLRARSTFEKALKIDPSNTRAAEGLQRIRVTA